MDALRMQDQKSVPYRSAKDGLMHGCGHDAHTAIVLGTALALQHVHGILPEPAAWRAIFQPAEESGGGAAEMVEAGAVEGVAAIVALHVDPEQEVGRIVRRDGPMTACCTEMHVAIHGRGGHAARPHQAIDPIAATVQFISSVYQNVPRSVDSREPSVVTFGAISGGTASNVIPDKVLLRGTIRTFSRVQTAAIDRKLRAIGRAVGEASGTTIELTFLHGPDAVVNDPAVTAVVSRAAMEVVGTERVLGTRSSQSGRRGFRGVSRPHAGVHVSPGRRLPRRRAVAVVAFAALRHR